MFVRWCYSRISLNERERVKVSRPRRPQKSDDKPWVAVIGSLCFRQLSNQVYYELDDHRPSILGYLILGKVVRLYRAFSSLHVQLMIVNPPCFGAADGNCW